MMPVIAHFKTICRSTLDKLACHRRFAVVAVVAAVVQLFVPESYADYPSADNWFTALPFHQKVTIQRSLIWTSGYSGLPDGTFGQKTYQSLSKFEASEGSIPDGILDQDQLRSLQEYSTIEQTKVRFSKLVDDVAQAEFWVPLSIVAGSTPTDSGLSISSPQGDVEIKSFRVPSSEATFVSLFSKLTASSPSRSVTSSELKPVVFVISGYIDSKAFYLCAYNTNNGTVGISIAWSVQRSEMQAIAFAVAASLSFQSELRAANTSQAAEKKKSAYSNRQKKQQLPSGEYNDLSGLERPQEEYESDKSGCSMYGRQVYQQCFYGETTANDWAKIGKAIACAIGRKRAFKQCMTKHYWEIL